ncbi:MAG: HAMP domain-containing histidine kinase, partial [Alphaproteobacteria bacterium]|nr:HAMP domain-containing histidine kinase [Alphaproteobacteria bacterium]
DPGEPPERQREALERAGRKLGGDFALLAPDGALIASFGRPPPHGGPFALGDLLPRDRGPPSFVVPLADGRRVLIRHPMARRPPLGAVVPMLAAIALALGIAAYPVVRRITRRLETLRTGVQAIGAGNLAARVPVEGRDEVAALASSFNDAAERIERLVAAQKSLLANASHELRSPLARLRLSAAIIGEAAPPAARAEIERNVAELDALVDEILTASRLAAVDGLDRVEPVDLLALAAEEAARVGADVSGVPCTVRGDPRLLRRMLRNLLENARRHGAPPVAIAVAPSGDRAEIRVRDGGPGVAEAERARIFEPFYRPTGTREDRGGYGLGLALVRQIARKHGGDAACEGAMGGGSAFRVWVAPVIDRLGT